MTKDFLFDVDNVKKGSFSFNENVVDVFDDMLTRSVPCFDIIQSMIVTLCHRYAQTDGVIYDFGCSRALTLCKIMSSISDRACHFIGLDNSEAMLKVASEKVTQLKCAHTFEFLPVDLNNYRDFNTSSVGVFNLVLQFLDLEARRELLQSFYKSLLPGGCIILIEKTISKDPNLQQFYLEQFRQYKQSNGYSLNEILMKEKALDGVLTPLSPDDNKSLLSDVGFNIIDSFFQWYNFTGIVAVKESL